MQMEKKDKTSRNALIYTVGNFFNMALSALSAPLFTRLLSTEDYGKTAIYSTWVSIFAIFTTLQLQGSTNNAYIEYGLSRYKAYVKNCITIAIIVMSILISGSFFFQESAVKLIGLDYKLIVLAIVNSFFNGTILLLADYLAVLQKAFLYVIATFAQLVLNIVFSVLLISYSGNIPAESRIYGGFSATFIVGIVIVIYFIGNKEKLIDKEFTKFGLALSLPLIFHSLSGIILTSCDKIMLSRIRDDSITGIYSFATTILSVISTIAVSFNTAWRPYYFTALKADNIEVLKKRTSSYLSCFMILACGFILVMPEVVKILAAREYWSCIPIVIPLVLSEFFNFLYYFPVNYEFYKMCNKWIPVATVVAGILNIIFNLVLIPRFGAGGAAFATMLSNFISLSLHDIVARFIIKDYYISWKVYLKYSIRVIIIAIVAFLTLEMWVIRWIIATVFGLILLRRISINKQLF